MSNHLIIGLGNPGKKYEKTRHNAGFIAVDFLLAHLRSPKDLYRSGGQALKFKENKKLKSLIAECEINNKKVILAKPQTYMNNSGEAVHVLIDYYKIKNLSAGLSAGALAKEETSKVSVGAKADKQPQNIIVVYDEIDLPFGKIRVRDKGSAAGHNGIKSIIEHLGTDEFNRVRIGISNDPRKTATLTRSKTKEKIPAEKFVLKKFSRAEQKELKQKILPFVVEKIKETTKR